MKKRRHYFYVGEEDEIQWLDYLQTSLLASRNILQRCRQNAWDKNYGENSRIFRVTFEEIK